MKKNNLYFCLFLLIATTPGCSKKDQPDPVIADQKSFTDFSFTVSKNNTLYQDIHGIIDGDTIYAPTFAGTIVTSLTPEFTYKGKQVTIDDVAQTSGSNAQDFRNLMTYTITASNGSTKKYIVKLEDTHLPTIYISTSNVPITSKEIYITGSMWIAGSLAGDTLYSSTLQIRGRGNSTWDFPKKPYKVKLDKKAPLLGMSSDKNWALLASYGDFTLIRDEVGFELGRRLGLAFTPAGRFADVILNGEYVGNYQLVQTIDVSSHKVDIAEQDAISTTLPDITGGFLLEVDGYAYSEPVHFYTPQGVPVTIHYPNDDDINPAQTDYITSYYTEFENKLFADDFVDSLNGYKKYLDLNSFVNYYLVNEIIANPDLFWSTYQYKTRNDPKIYTGPVWDFDLAANDDSRLGDAVNKLMLDAGHDPKQWINRLMQDAAFRHALRDRWNAVKNNVGSIDQFVDALAAQLDLSQRANFQKWDILNQMIHLNHEPSGSYKGEIDYLRSFLQTRIPWLDTQFNSSRFD